MTPPEAAAPVHLTLLGCGRAARMHARTLARLGGEYRLGFASRDPDRARALGAARGGVRWFGSYAEALEDAWSDAVLIATPPPSHLDLTVRALHAGKHVIVEKPPFLRSSDLDLVRAAEVLSGRRVFVAENYCYKPLCAAIRAQLDAGAIGDVLFVHVNALRRQADAGWRSDELQCGGGALFEGGIHWVHFMASLGLTVKSARGVRPGARGGVDRSMLVSLEYAEGAAGTLLYSWEAHSPLRGLRISRIYGTRGSITFESNGLFVLTTGRRPRLSFPGLPDISGFTAMFRDFAAALRSGEEPRMTLALARRDLELVEAIYRSAGEDAGDAARTGPPQMEKPAWQKPG